MQSHAPETLAQAQEEFEAELRLNPADAVAEYEIGQVLLAENKPREAAPRFERALATSPDFGEALLAVAKIRADAQGYDEVGPLPEPPGPLQPRDAGAAYKPHAGPPQPRPP